MKAGTRTLNDAVRDTIISILKPYEAERIAVFGSYARGQACRRSDIDILVSFKQPKSLLELVRIEQELAGALHMPVDLLTEKAISPYLINAVRNDAVVIFG
jgi:hypothetical protein